MQWSGEAEIGWQASSVLYEAHSLSGAANAQDVACLNTPTTSSSTLIYKVAMKDLGKRNNIFFREKISVKIARTIIWHY